MSKPGDQPAPDGARYRGPIGGFVIPGLTGIAGSGLLVAAWAVGNVEPQAGPLVLVGGALIIALVIGNPGNEAVVLVGTLLPGALLVALEPHHGCIDRVGPFLLLSVGAGLGLMFLGLILGLIVSRRAGIQPVRRPIAVAVLGGAAGAAGAAWFGLAASLASGTIC